MKKKIAVFSLVVFFAGAGGAQTIDISGTVTNGSGGGVLPNVNVSLKAQTGPVATTGADGTFHLTSTAVVRGESGPKGFCACRLNGTILEISASGNLPVSIELFTASGSKIRTLTDDIPSKGNYTFNLAAQRLPAALYIVRYCQGSVSAVYQYVPVSAARGASAGLRAPSVSAANLLKKTDAAVDTLVFSLSGFVTGLVPISSYIGQYDAVLQPQTIGGTSPGMALVPAGTFTMGSNQAYAQAAPPHQVTLTTSYYVDTLEVSQSEYQAITGTNPSITVGDTLPVEHVTWYDMLLFCNARSKKEGFDTVTTYTALSGGGAYPCAGMTNLNIDYHGKGYRLPTEAEWEYACQLNVLKGYQLTEWTTDFFSNYSGDAQTDPTGVSGMPYKVTRAIPYDGVVSCYFRSSDAPDGRNGGLGFRCVRPQ